jgi:hypothetical protein
MKKIRSYKKLVNEIINFQIPFRIDIIGYVEYGEDIYPIFEFKNTSKVAKKTVVITSGHHGDEEFAVHTLMKWVQKFNPAEYPEFNVYIYPCLNPYGYETGSRDNGARQDTNNNKKFYKNSNVQELAVLFDEFPVNVDLILDIHGDTGAKGKAQVYMYEHKAEGLESIAQKVMVENDSLIPYIKAKTIYKCPVIKGVIVPPPWDIGVEGAMEKLGVEYTLTLELPGKFDGQKRAIGGIAMIESVLRNYKVITSKQMPILEVKKDENKTTS